MQKINLDKNCEIVVRVPSETGTIANRVYYDGAKWHLTEYDENYDSSRQHITDSLYTTDEECAGLSAKLSELFTRNCGFEVRAHAQ